jgi:hypothetical protein
MAVVGFATTAKFGKLYYIGDAHLGSRAKWKWFRYAFQEVVFGKNQASFIYENVLCILNSIKLVF